MTLLNLTYSVFLSKPTNPFIAKQCVAYPFALLFISHLANSFNLKP